jgi:two-component system, chemotaxis family, protein-glutamate methylesterase/glutaminase
MTARPTRVLVVDDSAVVRRLVRDALSNDPEVEVVGTAVDPYAARDRILELKPDVLTLDIEMPRMDGLTFLRILMREKPMPVIVMSSLTAEGSVHALEALRLGAVDILAKPGGPYSFGELGPRLLATVKAAARARLRRPSAAVLAGPPESATETQPRSARPSGLVAPRVPVLALPLSPRPDPRRLILLGSSTGGTEALREIMPRLPNGLPPIAIVQHIPATFSKAFADRLGTLCDYTVREAVDGEPLVPGLALVAPGNYHLVVHWTGAGYRVAVREGPQVWHQRPAVDVMFKSIPAAVAPYLVAGVLTGMGRDGADGLLRLRNLGATTFAQDEASCVVYGMPKAAWENQGAQRQLALDTIPEFLVHAATSPVSFTPRPAPAHV